MICVSIAEPDYLNCKKALEKTECAEIRMDMMDLKESEIQEIFSYPGKDIIATCRPGKDKYNDEERLEKLKTAITSGATFVDVEIETSEAFKGEIIPIAVQNKCKVIVSFHDFEKTPSSSELEDIVEQCFEQGADIAKVACMIHSKQDISRILSLYDRDNNIVAIGMGELGKITRIAAPFLGAPFTYASLNSGKETAKGQLTKHMMEKILEMIEHA
jgi:3-dehydroquinate dehydratase-1